jgi:hypothetical protein
MAKVKLLQLLKQMKWFLEGSLTFLGVVRRRKNLRKGIKKAFFSKLKIKR